MAMSLFPLDIATGNAFCNRKIERKHLLENILSHTDTLINAPRRYGKTSLVEQVKCDLNRKYDNFIFLQIDYLLVGTPESAQSYLLESIAETLSKIIPLRQQALDKVVTIFKSLKTKISIGSNGLLLEIEPHPLPEKGINEALMTLDNIVGKQKKIAVIFMDEFQQLGELSNNEAIEAAIRHAAQYAKHSIFIFTGSNRHLLRMMFDDSARPLYHMCDRIVLDRIAAEDYIKFIQRAAQKKWGSGLKSAVLNSIIGITNRHPHYMNVLCNKLWHLSSLPRLKDVESSWMTYVSGERQRVSTEINALSNFQREFLTLLATKPTSQPRSSSYLKASTIKSGTVGQLLDKLLTQDLIFVDAEGVYRLIDPVIEETIKRINR